MLATCVPQIWPEDIATVLTKSDGVLDSKQRQLMIRTITNLAVENGFSKDEFSEMAEYVLKEIFHLRSKVVQGPVAMVAAMKACLRYKKSYANKKARKELQDNSNQSPEEIQSNMKDEMIKSRPSLNILKVQLTALRKRRQQLVKTSSAIQQLKDFPALEKSELILWVFTQITTVKLELMEIPLEDILPKFAEHYNVKDRASLSPDVLAVNTILTMCNVFAKKKKGNDGTGIFRIYPITTVIADTVPKENDHPCMVTVGDPGLEDLYVVVYVDTLPVFSGKIKDALLHLVASYYVFQEVSWPAEDKLPLILLTASVIPEKMGTEIKKSKLFLSTLEAVKSL